MFSHEKRYFEKDVTLHKRYVFEFTYISFTNIIVTQTIYQIIYAYIITYNLYALQINLVLMCLNVYCVDTVW